MTKKRRKMKEHKGLVSVEVLMKPELKTAADTVAGYDHKTRSEYIRELILTDVRRRGLCRPEGER